MDKNKTYYIKKSTKNYRAAQPTQTGFSSPATHYSEPRIDLNDELVKNASATFYVRVVDESFSDFGINEKDVLIIDKSLTPKNKQLIIANQDEAFKIIKIGTKIETEFHVWGVITYVIKHAL